MLKIKDKIKKGKAPSSKGRTLGFRPRNMGSIPLRRHKKGRWKIGFVSRLHKAGEAFINLKN